MDTDMDILEELEEFIRDIDSTLVNCDESIKEATCYLPDEEVRIDFLDNVPQYKKTFENYRTSLDSFEDDAEEEDKKTEKQINKILNKYRKKIDKMEKEVDYRAERCELELEQIEEGTFVNQ